MNRRGAGLTAVVLTALVATTGCGYGLVGSGSSVFPPEIQSLAIRPFENRTQRPEIEQRVTEEVAREFAKRGRQKIVKDPSTADAVMDGAIVNWNTLPVEFNDAGRAVRLETTVTMQATVRKGATDEVLWSQSSLIFREQYNVSDDRTFFDEETLALDVIARGAASTLVTSLVEGF